MYNQTVPANGCGHNGMGGTFIPSYEPPRSADKPSGIIEQAAEMVASAIGEVRTARSELAGIGDCIFGERPESPDKTTTGNIPSGRGNQLIANAQELHRVLGELHAEVKRLVSAL